MKTALILFGAILFSVPTFAQNVGIGTNNPDPSAKLDISSSNSGMLVPRVSLLSITDVVTVPSPS
ncbi:hypothetical protein OAK35_04280 [Crocinitomicaceae bacterium]|nr:hypothetical protein [Crocinitomicaceae bacterium]MDC0257943.1 hypothetical protein [Crocinitomicaceae bacterium]